jgi:glutathione peroxidase-family protein
LTNQNYTELVALHERYQAHGHGLVILGFPCNQFGGQEPGTNAQIRDFAARYNVQFPMMDKIKVNGSDALPLFRYLKVRLPGTFGNFIKWNFTKFLVDHTGTPVKRFGPKDSPLSFEADIKALLDAA